MRIGLIADVHGNLPALEAALGALHGRGVDAIYSLGDQINLGPCPRETLALLREAGVTCLHGNHERYVLAAMAGDPAYDAVNFTSLRFNAALLTAQEITFPHALRVGGATLCHALPEDDRFPVHEVEKALPILRERAGDAPEHIICGHGHNPHTYRVGALTISGLGSTGCMDDGIPGLAMCAVADIDGGEVVLTPGFAHYDPRRLKPLFKASGMAGFCPVMAHITCEQMSLNQNLLVPFVTRALDMAKSRGEKQISRATWADCDASFDWPGGVGTAEYWR